MLFKRIEYNSLLNFRCPLCMDMWWYGCIFYQTHTRVFACTHSTSVVYVHKSSAAGRMLATRPSCVPLCAACLAVPTGTRDCCVAVRR